MDAWTQADEVQVPERQHQMNQCQPRALPCTRLSEIRKEQTFNSLYKLNLIHLCCNNIAQVQGNGSKAKYQAEKI